MKFKVGGSEIIVTDELNNCLFKVHFLWVKTYCPYESYGKSKIRKVGHSYAEDSSYLAQTSCAKHTQWNNASQFTWLRSRRPLSLEASCSRKGHILLCLDYTLVTIGTVLSYKIEKPVLGKSLWWSFTLRRNLGWKQKAFSQCAGNNSAEQTLSQLRDDADCEVRKKWSNLQQGASTLDSGFGREAIARRCTLKSWSKHLKCYSRNIQLHPEDGTAICHIFQAQVKGMGVIAREGVQA